MTINKSVLLLSNGFVEVPQNTSPAIDADKQIVALGTVLSQFAYYGYIPSAEATTALSALSSSELGELWKTVKPGLEEITGANRNIGDFVVYKNFPREVLEMSKARYWAAQVLMYMGVPNRFFTEKPEEREPMAELPRLKVLALAGSGVEDRIYQSLVLNKSRWTDAQKAWAEYLFGAVRLNHLDIGTFGFKENGITLAIKALENGADVNVGAATDVLRLAMAMSGGDPSLRVKSKFRSFKREERRKLIALIEGSSNIVDDFYMRPEQWKRLLRALRPGDLKSAAAKTSAAYDALYRGTHKTYASKVEAGLKTKDKAVLDILVTRPGDFLRRFHQTYAAFGADAVTAFLRVAPSLNTNQLLKLDRYLLRVNARANFIVAPKGNWTRAQIVPNTKVQIGDADVKALRDSISATIGGRLNEQFPEGFSVDASADQVKLQTSDQKLAPYGRGTVFPIPANMTFVRSASYWAFEGSYSNVWYDLGWNFFDENWKSLGACCWDATHLPGSIKGAVFSGDPTNSKDLKGRACQMIDLYPDLLLTHGVRYAIMNVLCYSGKAFDEAEEVLATLQWGECAETGKLYEPSRAQMVFPLTGENKTKYVCYIDLKERKLVYVDANLRGQVHSAKQNGQTLETLFPAFLEYIDAVPSVADLFLHAKTGTIPVVYSDDGVEIKGKGFAFKRENPANDFEAIDLAQVIAE